MLYKELLEIATDQSVYLEEFARNQIAAEELHNMDIKKMQRDYEGDETVIVRSALSLRLRCGVDDGALRLLPLTVPRLFAGDGARS